METFATDLLELQKEWPVWYATSLDERKRSVTLTRRDDYPVTLLVSVSREYPHGTTTLRDRGTKAVYATSGAERLIDAIDNALLRWDEEERKTRDETTDSYGIEEEPLESPESHVISYEDALCAVSTGSQGLEEEEGTEEQLFVRRNLALWQALANEAPNTHVFLNKERQCITLHVSIAIRDIDALLCLALGFRDAEYVTVEADVPMAFPLAAPRVHRIVMCNYPDAMNDTDDVYDDKLGVFAWYAKNRLEDCLQCTSVDLYSRSIASTDAAVEAAADPTTSSSNRGLAVSFLSRDELLADEITFGASIRALAQEGNLLKGLSRKLMELITGSTKECFICAAPLPMDGMRMMHCPKDLCTFSVERMGLGVDVLSEIVKRQEVFELLMLFVYSSITNADKRDVFTPMCNVDIAHRRDILGLRGPSNFFINEAEKKGKNFRLLLEVLQFVPSVQSMIAMANGSNDILRRALDARHLLMYPFVQWIIASNRSHLQFIPTLYHVKGLGSYQYLLINHNAEKEHRFRALKAAAARKNGGAGSFFAWHGSSTCNWHCILRDGLRVYSGTRYMSSGQVYGSGIYLARSIVTSLPYMGSSKGNWAGSSLFTNPNGCTVMALCEVVANSAIYTDHNADIITVSDEESISIRFLFVFHGYQSYPFSLASLPPNEDIAAQLSASFSFLL